MVMSIVKFIEFGAVFTVLDTPYITGDTARDVKVSLLLRTALVGIYKFFLGGTFEARHLI